MSITTNLDLLSRVGHRLLAFGYSGKAVLRHAATFPLEERAAYLAGAFRHFKKVIKTGTPWKCPPVDIRTFIESPEFLAQKNVIYPRIMGELVEMNNGLYVEAVMTGAIGVGKTTIALFSQAYQLYVLSCIINPQRLFRLAPSDEILIVFQSLTAKAAKDVDFDRFRTMLSTSPYFRDVFPFDKDLTSELRFPNRIQVIPMSGNPQAAIGRNVIGGIIDEVNFMAKVEQSKNSVDGGFYDQALEMYNSIVRRRKSRFLIKGKMFGLLCLVSSKRYPGEFTDQKAAESKKQLSETGRTDIYVYDRRLWEVKPDDTYCGDWFRVFCGDAAHKPRVLEEGETLNADLRHLILSVPIEFKSEFSRDLLSAIREIGGMTTLSMHPFIMDTEAVSEAFGKAPSILSREDCDFVQTKVLIYPERFVNPKEPRFAHVDLGLSNDSAGIAVGHVTKFIEMQRGGWSETLPVIRYDLTLEVKPPRHGEIEFAKIRTLFYKLRELGLNLRWISFDTYQSVDSMQILTQQGFITGTCSMDTDPVCYDLFKTALYDRRVEAPMHPKAQLEIIRLERDPKTGKIDHPADGSKDVSDAMAGVVYGLTMRREIWLRHNIPITKVPSYLVEGQKKALVKDEKKLAA
jgi:hypothetical protein